MNKDIQQKVESLIEEFREKVNPVIESNQKLYGEGSISEWLKKNTDKHLFSNTVYGEPMLDIDEEKVAEWLQDKLTTLLQETEKAERENFKKLSLKYFEGIKEGRSMFYKSDDANEDIKKFMHEVDTLTPSK